MRGFLGAITSATALLLLIASPASAAQEMGDRCVGNDSAADRTAIVLNNGVSNVDLQFREIVFPEGPRVITRWKAQVGPGLAPLAQQLVALRQVGEESDQPVGASAVETLATGTNEFLTRIPVPEYAHIGLRGPTGTLFCDHESGHLGGIVEGPWALGEPRHFKVETNLGVPVIAFVEPDRDNDGYGDETQDGCPWNATLQTECPPVTPKVDSVATKERAILVEVGVSSQAQVQVFGQVSWKVRPKAGQSDGRARKGDRGLTVGLSAGAPRTVLPGTVASFRVPLAKAVLRRLGRLTPQQVLKAQITIRTTDLAGRENDRLVTVKLHGRRR